MSTYSSPNTDRLDNLKPDGTPPETRLADAQQAQAMVLLMVQADNGIRGRKRALVQGLVDGNPPYQMAKLKAAGRADACNVNWRESESFLNAALGAFYDIFNEAPTYATVKTDAGNPQQKQEWSDIITEEFERLQRRDTSFDYNMQISQYEMVLFGVGPLMFPDKYDWRPWAVRCKNLLVQENAKSDVNLWELCVIRRTYKPDELYALIMNEEAATKVGWNVEATKQAIMSAMPKQQQNGAYLDWQWYQQQLKNGSFYWASQPDTIEIDHIYFKEFPTGEETEGKITHVMIQENTAQTDENKGLDFLFQHIGRFDNWQECVHAMYYDHGGGGEHHSVTGMGVKMYGAMEYKNRLLCNLADKAFAPKILFKPTTPDAKQKASVVHLGDYGVLPAGYEVQQTGVAGLLNDGLEFNREVGETIASNLSSYRQNLQQKSGNPVTATQVQYDASEQARLGKTQLNRYYAQLDRVYAEKFRRAANPKLTKTNPGGKEAIEFQERCTKRGVPKEALDKIDSVIATRIIGQGSAYMRQQSLEFLLGMVQMLPEQGRENLISDTIAARAGQSMVKRYFDVSSEAQKPTEQNTFAMMEVASAKVGVPPVPNDKQNPVIYAQTYLQAASQALTSVQSGGNPMEVLSFLETIGPAIQAQLQRIQADKSRANVFKALDEQFKQVAKLSDELKGHVEQMMKKAQQEQQGKQQVAKESIAINYADAPPSIQRQIEAHAGFQPATDAPNPEQTKIDLHSEKAKQAMELKAESHQQNLQHKAQATQLDNTLKDARTANDIRNSRIKAEADAKAKLLNKPDSQENS